MTNYLTERHTSQLRAQMLKAAAARGSNAPSPVPGAEAPAGHPAVAEHMRRISGTGRAGSALSMRQQAATPLSRDGDEEGGAPVAAGPSTKSNFPTRPPSSRTPPANVAVASQNHPVPRPATATRLGDPQRRRFPYLSSQQQQQEEEHDEQAPLSRPASPSSSSSAASSSSESPVQSRIIRRPPRFHSKDTRGAGVNSRGGGAEADDDDDDGEDNGHNANDDDDDDDDDAEPAFLPPFKPPQAPSASAASAQSMASSSGQDLGATLRGDGVRGGPAVLLSQTSDSSVGSAAVVSKRPVALGVAVGAAGTTPGGGEQRRLLAGYQGGPLSPRRTAELSGRGVGAGKGKGASREGSDGTPSMGSSFSDLDGELSELFFFSFIAPSLIVWQMPRSRSRHWRRLWPAVSRTERLAAG